MAVAFYIPSVDEDEPVKPNQAYHQQQVGQQQQQSNQSSSVASSDVSQQVCAEALAELQKQHLMMVFHEILVAYAREAVLAQQPATPKTLPTSSEPCLLCKKLYYLFRRFY